MPENISLHVDVVAVWGRTPSLGTFKLERNPCFNHVRSKCTLARILITFTFTFNLSVYKQYVSNSVYVMQSVLL